MEPIVFRANSSSSREIYDVVVTMHGDQPRMSCTCEAGQNLRPCKHRLMLLAGDLSALVTIDRNSVNRLQTLFHGSSVLDAISEIRSLEKQADQTRTAISNAKKKLGKMLG